MSDVGDLNVRINLDALGFQNGVSKINTEMRRLQSEFKLASAQLGQHGSELDKLRLKSDQLTKEAELQRQKVRALEEAHRKSVEAKGADARATQELEIKLNQARARLVTMEQDLEEVNNELTIQSSSWHKFSRSMEQAGETMRNTGEKMADIGEKMSMGITAPITAAGAVLLKGAVDAQTAQNKLQASLGITAQEAQKLGGIAQEVWQKAFSGSIEEAAQAVTVVRKNMAGLAGTELQAVTESVLTIAQVFSQDVNEVTAAAGVMMKNFGISGQEALDIITVGFQQGGDFSGELLDTLREYAPQFKSLGLSADQAMAMLIKGAEAGAWNLDKVGDAMKEFNLRAQDGSTTTAEGFAAIGLNAQEMGVAIAAGGEEAEKAFLATVTALANMEDPLEQNLAGTALFGTQWEDVRENVITALVEGKDGLTDFQGATAEATRAIQENNPGLAITQALRAVQAAIGPALLPVAEIISNRVVPALKSLADWFTNLSPAGQTAALAIAGLAAAIGPLLLIGGKLIGVAGAVAGALSTVSAALAVVTTGAAATTPVVGTLASVFTTLAGPVGIAVAAIAGLTVASAALYKHLSQKSIPAIELFGDEVSESTQKAMGGFLALNDQATLALNQLSWSGQEVTREMADNIAGNFAQMASQVQAGLDKHHEESLAKIQGFVTSSAALSQAEQDEILNNMQQGYETRKQTIAEGEARIKEILDMASTEKRALTRAEQEEINAIQRQMVDTGIQVLSDNEIEAKAIMERMKAQATELTALQAAEVVKNSIEQRDGAIKAANEQYDQVIKEIIRQRDEAGTISKEQADKLIAEATRQKDESIAKAEEMHLRVVAEAQAQAQEHVNQVDWETGEIKTKWQVMRDDIFAKAGAIKENVFTTWEEIKTNTAEQWESIRATMSDRWNDIKTNTAETVASIKENVSTTWDEVKTKTFETWDNIKTKTADTWLAIQNKIDEHGGGIKGLIKTFTEEYKSVWNEALSFMEEITGIKFSDMADKVIDALERVKSAISNAIDRIKEWNDTHVKEKVFSITETITRIIRTITSGGGADSNFSGTSFFQGGLTVVGELGPELVALPRGSRIYSDHETKQILSGNKGITQNITINSPTPLTPAETARRIKNASRQLALEW